jgi:hypothetical protein
LVTYLSTSPICGPAIRVTIACEPRQSVASISEIGHVPSAFWNRCNIRIRWTLPTDADSRRRGLRERPIPSSGPLVSKLNRQCRGRLMALGRSSVQPGRAE